MTTVIEQGVAQGIEQGIERGVAQGIEQGVEMTKRDMVVSMYENDYPIESIMKITKLSENAVMGIINNTI